MASMTGMDSGGDGQTIDIVQMQTKLKVTIHSKFGSPTRSITRMPE